MKRRPVFMAATAVVPLPAQMSATTAPRAFAWDGCRPSPSARTAHFPDNAAHRWTLSLSVQTCRSLYCIRCGDWSCGTAPIGELRMVHRGLLTRTPECSRTFSVGAISLWGLTPLCVVWCVETGRCAGLIPSSSLTGSLPVILTIRGNS